MLVWPPALLAQKQRGLRSAPREAQQAATPVSAPMVLSISESPRLLLGGMARNGRAHLVEGDRNQTPRKMLAPIDMAAF
jgi:hypothetical protein